MTRPPNPTPESFASTHRARAACRSVHIAATLLMVLVCADSVRAQQLVFPVSVNRSVSAITDCSQCTPDSYTLSSTELGRFTSMVHAHSSTNGEFNYADARASQDTTIAARLISGSATVSAGQRNGTANGTSSCIVTFTVPYPCDAALLGNCSGFIKTPMEASAYVYGPSGPIMSMTLYTGYSPCFAHSERRLFAGPYTLDMTAVALATGVQLDRFGTFDFSLQLTELPAPLLPAVISGPIRGPDHCSRYYQLAPSGWTEAEVKAGHLGGHLVTVDNAEEQAWLLTTFAGIGPEYKWIGLNAADYPGTQTFVWTDGTPPGYANWRQGLPIPLGGDFVLFRSGGDADAGRWIQSANLFPGGAVGGIVEDRHCMCDYNDDGVINSADYFDFLQDFFVGAADFNCSGTSDSTDFYDFLACFLSGCS